MILIFELFGMTIEGEFEGIHKFGVLLLLFLCQPVILLPGSDPELCISLDKELIFEGLQVFAHLRVHFERHSHHYLPKVIGLAQNHQLVLNVLDILDQRFYLNENSLRQVWIVQQLPYLVLRRRIQFVDFYLFYETLESLPEVS